ncbi:MAG: hypothetical protein ACR2HP_07965 [Ilumatobacteraceae bacterium]
MGARHGAEVPVEQRERRGAAARSIVGSVDRLGERVDELNLMIEPILLGGGKRIFPEDGTARPMQLVKCVTAVTGVQICTYHPAS